MRVPALSRVSTSADLFRTIFNSVTDGILIFDINGRILEANQVLCDRLEYSRDELLAMDILQIDTAASGALFQERLGQILSQGYATFEVEHLRRDGTTIPLEVGSRAIEYDGVPAVLSVQRDITERRRAEAQARQQASFFEQLLDAIPSPIVAKSADGRIRLANRAFLASVGRTREEVLGSTIAEIGLAEAPQWLELDQTVLETGEVVQSETWTPQADGARRLIISRAPYRDEEHRIVGTIATAVDITARYLAEQGLRQSEERFRTLFESASDAIYMIDANGRFIEANRSGAEGLGYTQEEMRQLALADICRPEVAPLLPGQIADILERGAVSFEATHVRRDGSMMPVELRVTRIELEGRPALLGISRDVTERKRAEAEREKLEAQLRQAQKMDGIGRLASGIAHDFNNLLTAIGGFASLAMTGLPEDDPSRRDIEQIREATDRATALTRQLLSFSRASTKVEPKPVNVGEVVSRLEHLLRRLISEDIELVVDASRSRMCVLADAGQLEQVIVNLAVNAKDAMTKGGRLTIRAIDTEVDDEFAQAIGGTPGPNVQILVIDTGTGMDEATRERLFEPFFTTKAPGVGTGLGLATVYGIVHSWRGGVTVHTELGSGSTFEVFLPRAEGNPESGPVVERRPAFQDGRGKRILVVEDSDEVLQLTVRLLQQSGYEVVPAKNAPIAVAVGRSGRFDLLLTDLVMPSIQGDQVAVELRSGQPGLGVVYMSGYGERLVTQPAEPGIYLPKPFSADELLKAVRDALEWGRARSELGLSATPPRPE